MSRFTSRLALAASALTITALALTACGSSGSLDEPASSGSAAGGSSDTITVGSQAYYSNEIIAEIYAQALEGAGFTVEKKFNIGQRDAIIPSLQDGTVQITPEYTGNLLQYFDKTTTATTTDDVYAALEKALPEGLSVLDQSPATDQDSYNVTAAFAKEHNLKSIADLAGITPLVLGGAPELEQRPYGPSGLKDKYGVDVTFSATADTTVDELVAGNVQLADVYSADPSIKTKDLVTLEDPKGLFLASHVVPLVSSSFPEDAAAVINKVSAALTPDGLIALNVASKVDQKSPGDLAKSWLADNGIQ
ncbi:ABC transporter substrate-binding protein [Microbacterium flavum]|uniref:ABC transporter substrate-binding protein n=1 Tax=Microbacterium flavum TaxID=415216 RepID=A0ABS5XXI9_9MICO|nr:ABC transporter substrate-binding protein [Microbacterium flavum]MBT8799244.1 ABC transporter substrate-binding protein [Microbacterium flavum]